MMPTPDDENPPPSPQDATANLPGPKREFQSYLDEMMEAWARGTTEGLSEVERLGQLQKYTAMALTELGTVVPKTSDDPTEMLQSDIAVGWKRLEEIAPSSAHIGPPHMGSPFRSTYVSYTLGAAQGADQLFPLSNAEAFVRRADEERYRIARVRLMKLATTLLRELVARKIIEYKSDLSGGI